MWTLLLKLTLLVQVDHGNPEVPIAGLLEVPEVFGEFACDRFVPERIDVHAGPSAESGRIGVLETTKPWYVDEESDCEWIEVALQNDQTGEPEPMWFMEYAYEEPGLVVLERRGDWFRIQADATDGWMLSGVPDRFHAYEALVSESLAYIQPGWSGALWAGPGVGTPTAVPDAWRPYLDRQQTIEVLESAVVGEALWFRIRFDADYGCGGLEGDLPMAEGWVPGYRESGPNQIWFYSRGC